MHVVKLVANLPLVLVLCTDYSHQRPVALNPLPTSCEEHCAARLLFEFGNRVLGQVCATRVGGLFDRHVDPCRDVGGWDSTAPRQTVIKSACFCMRHCPSQVVTCSSYGTSTAEEAVIASHHVPGSTLTPSQQGTVSAPSYPPAFNNRAATSVFILPPAAHAFNIVQHDTKSAEEARTPGQAESSTKSKTLQGNYTLPAPLPTTLSTSGVTLCYGQSILGATKWKLAHVAGGLISLKIDTKGCDFTSMCSDDKECAPGMFASLVVDGMGALTSQIAISLFQNRKDFYVHLFPLQLPLLRTKGSTIGELNETQAWQEVKKLHWQAVQHIAVNWVAVVGEGASRYPPAYHSEGLREHSEGWTQKDEHTVMLDVSTLIKFRRQAESDGGGQDEFEADQIDHTPR